MEDTGSYHAAVFLPDPGSRALGTANMDANVTQLGAAFQCSFITLLRAVRHKCIVVNPSGTNWQALKSASWHTFLVLQLFYYLHNLNYLI